MLKSFWNHLVEVYKKEDKDFKDRILLDVVALSSGIIVGNIVMAIWMIFD